MFVLRYLRNNLLKVDSVHVFGILLQILGATTLNSLSIGMIFF